MKVFKSRESCFIIEENEYKLNLVCERKFVAIHQAHSTNVPYTKELLDSVAHHEYESICDNLTVDILTKFKDKVLKDEFRAFLRVRADRSIVGDRLNFSNIPGKNKETLIDGCVKERNVPVKARLILERPLPPTLLEPSMIDAH